MFKPRRTSNDDQGSERQEPVQDTPPQYGEASFFPEGSDPFTELERLVEETRASLDYRDVPATQPRFTQPAAALSSGPYSAPYSPATNPAAAGFGASASGASASDPFVDDIVAVSQSMKGGVTDRTGEGLRAAFAQSAPATGAGAEPPVDWDDPFDAELLEQAYRESTPDYTREAMLDDPVEEPAPSGLRRFMPLLIVVCLVVAGGAGYVLVSGNTGTAPKVVAGPSASDLKGVVANASQGDAARQPDVLDPKASQAQAANEHVVPRADTSTLPVAAGDASTPVTPDSANPRKVRTVIVRPDGTVLDSSGGTPQTVQTNDGQTALAGLAGAAPGRKPQAATVTPPQVVPALDGNGAGPAAAAQPGTASKPSQTASTSAPAIGNSNDVPTALPQARPVTPGAPDLPGTPGRAAASADNAPVDLAAQKPADKAPARPARLAAGSAVAQLSSEPSEAEARRMFAHLQKKFPDLMASQSLDVQQADVKGKTYFRVRVGPFADKAAAKSFCESYKGAGGRDCIVPAN